jgi:hypothetical protein
MKPEHLRDLLDVRDRIRDGNPPDLAKWTTHELHACAAILHALYDRAGHDETDRHLPDTIAASALLRVVLDELAKREKDPPMETAWRWLHDCIQEFISTGVTH